jgi:hypothetical protein
MTNTYTLPRLTVTIHPDDEIQPGDTVRRAGMALYADESWTVALAETQRWGGKTFKVLERRGRNITLENDPFGVSITRPAARFEKVTFEPYEPKHRGTHRVFNGGGVMVELSTARCSSDGGQCPHCFPEGYALYEAKHRGFYNRQQRADFEVAEIQDLL